MDPSTGRPSTRTGPAPVQDSHPDIGGARPQGDVPARKACVFEHEVAGGVATEDDFFVGQGDLGACMHAGQNLHGPEAFCHGSLPTGSPRRCGLFC